MSSRLQDLGTPIEAIVVDRSRRRRHVKFTAANRLRYSHDGDHVYLAGPGVDELGALMPARCSKIVYRHVAGDVRYHNFKANRGRMAFNRRERLVSIRAGVRAFIID